MIYPEDETIIVNALSCTKDEAVAKMLGWMRSPVRLKYIKVTSLGIQPDQLEHMHSIEGSILDLLNEQREIARNALLDLAEEAAKTQDETHKNALHDLINGKDNDIVVWQERINKASSYLHAIDTELAKGNHSTLRVDNKHINDKDEALIMLDSLDEWTKSNYGISIRDEIPTESQHSQKTIQEPKRSDALRIEIIEILNTMQKPIPAKVMHALRAKIGSEFTCILANDDDGLIWVDNNGKKQVIKIKALGERIRKLISPS